jgi:hypothetical protein
MKMINKGPNKHILLTSVVFYINIDGRGNLELALLKDVIL